MSFIFHEGFSISVIVITVVDLKKTIFKTRPQITLHHSTYYHPTPANDDQDKNLMYVHYGDDYVNKDLEPLAEGLEVDHKPPQGPSSRPMIQEFPEGDYFFEHTMYGRPRKDNSLLYHIVLPEYCYINRHQFDNNTQDDIIIATRTVRQTIDCIFREGSDLKKTVYFVGPNESEFKRIHNRFPKYYLKPGVRFPEA